MSAAPILLIAVILLSVAAPLFGILLCCTILALQVSSIVVRILVSRIDAPLTLRANTAVAPVFSIHVATHNDPPVMVQATLQALAAQTWSGADYEIILIDNNTCDPGLWEPVRDVCARLGPRFRFFHRKGVKEAKAGALNIALSETRADATHIVTVDADYRVAPHFLTLAARALARTGADYIQFPQAYACCETVAAGIDTELEEYFRTHARMADEVEAVLLTGTLSVISKSALEAVGGWSGKTTTEDAELGVRLCRRGFYGRFVMTVVGRGLLPFSLRDLETQRHRWASGNFRTLIVHASAILLGRDGLGWRQRGAILSQLTAWLNLLLLPTGILLVALLSEQAETALAGVASASILFGFAVLVGHLAWRGLHDGKAPMVIVAAIAQRIALAPVSALATVEVIFGKPMHFVVTNKSCAPRAHRTELPIATLMLFGTAALGLISAAQGGWPTVAAVLVLTLPLPAALATARTLNRYRVTLAHSGGGVLA